MENAKSELHADLKFIGGEVRFKIKSITADG